MRGFFEGGPAVAASLEAPTGVAINPLGGFNISDGRAVLHVDASDLIRTVHPAAGDALEALADDVDGSLLVADFGGRQLLRVAPGASQRVAGNGRCCWDGNGGPAAGATLFGVGNVAVGPARRAGTR